MKQYILRQAAVTEAELAYIESMTRIKKLRKKQYLLQEGDTRSH